MQASHRYPSLVPEGVRVAWMQTDEAPQAADLVFATREVRKDWTRLNLELLCPTDERREGGRDDVLVVSVLL